MSDITLYAETRVIVLEVAAPGAALTASLEALKTLTPAANKLPYFTGPAAAALADFTAFGRTVTALADAAAGRTALGLGTAAVANTGAIGAVVPILNQTNTFTGTQIVDGNGAGVQLAVRSSAATQRFLTLQTGTGHRWLLMCNATAESGSDTGSDFELRRYGDAGAQLTNVFTAIRSTGVLNFGVAPTILGADIVLVSGGTFTGPITLAADPVSALQPATKQYVDNLAAGLDVKASVKVATTANITLSGEQTIDGVLTSASRVLVKDQSTPNQNGIYVSAAGAWTRATDMDAWTEVPGANVFVEEGTVNADTAWVCTANAGGTLNTTAITWSKFGGTGAYQATNANLTQFSALSLVADQLPYANGTGTLALTSFTAFGRSLAGAADAAATRTLLALGTAATVNTGTSGATIPLLNADLVFSGRHETSKVTAITGSIAPGALGADQNNWAPTGHATAPLIITSATGASRTITGLSAVGVVDGDIRAIQNDDLAGFYIYFLSESASSTATNRFKMSGTITLGPGSVVFFRYDGAALRWKPWNFGGNLLQATNNLNDLTNLTTARIALGVNYIEATQTYNPASIAAAGAGAEQTITGVTGAALGAMVVVSFSLDMAGMYAVGYVSAADTVKYRFINPTGGAVDLASGTVRVRVWA